MTVSSWVCGVGGAPGNTPDGLAGLGVPEIGGRCPALPPDCAAAHQEIAQEPIEAQGRGHRFG